MQSFLKVGPARKTLYCCQIDLKLHHPLTLLTASPASYTLRFTHVRFFKAVPISHNTCSNDLRYLHCFHYRPPKKLRECNLSFCPGKGDCIWSQVPSGGEVGMPGPRSLRRGKNKRVHRLVGTPEGWVYQGIYQVYPLVLTSSGGHQSGRYASHWNAFCVYSSSVNVILFKTKKHSSRIHTAHFCRLYVFQ